eukprot:m.603411 g.603411  ORF g.603411 m.603411 type:complete len:185 (-) comp22452_c3_seq26:2643-3197(-)
MVGIAIVKVDGSTSGGISWIKSFYFAVVSVTTVGYGDVTVATDVGKAVMMVYLLIATVLFARIILNIASIPLKRRERRLEEMILSQFGRALDKRELEVLCEGGQTDGQCTKAEFILRMLVWLGRANPRDIELCAKQFDLLDKTHDGVLSVEDVKYQSPPSDDKLAALHLPLRNQSDLSTSKGKQ